MRSLKLSQRGRFIALVIEVVALSVASRIALGNFFPPPGGTGFWYYTALLGLVMGSRLDTPHFVVPADVLLYAAPAATALLLESNWAAWATTERCIFAGALGYAVAVGLIAVVAILCQSREPSRLGTLSATAKILAEHLGTPRLIYSVLLLFALATYHRNSAREVLVISSVWVALAWAAPADLLFALFHRIRAVLHREIASSAEGDAIAYHAPGVILVRPTGKTVLAPKETLALRDGAGVARAVMVLDQIGHSEGNLWRTLEIPEMRNHSRLIAETALVPTDTFVRLRSKEIVADSPLIGAAESVIGVVAENSSIHELFVDLTDTAGVEEGRLVCVRFGGRDVMFQIVNGMTREEAVMQRAKFGYVRAQTRKIGSWDDTSNRFRHAKWIPAMNSPVTLAPVCGYTHVADCIGHFPQTNYGVRLRSDEGKPTGLHMMVTHNTAILGILGVGKSSLAIELLERMMASGIKVVCVDLTNQYATELAPYFHGRRHELMRTSLNKTGKEGRTCYSRNTEEGGSGRKFAEKLRGMLAKFFKEDHPLRLLILNPAEFEVWKQTGRMFRADDIPAMAPLTPAEITQLVAESALAAVSAMGMTDTARVCLVFEEAHSLVPEWNSAVNDGDKSAANGTARAILQGRKYGMGCLLISQRTANVTKTILNQCNTVFAMRTFDDTGKEFLANYLGKEYASVLPSLEERHAVFFGRGSACENPVLMRVNDRKPWVSAFRAAHPPPPLPEDGDENAASSETDAGESAAPTS